MPNYVSKIKVDNVEAQIHDTNAHTLCVNLRNDLTTETNNRELAIDNEKNAREVADNQLQTEITNVYNGSNKFTKLSFDTLEIDGGFINGETAGSRIVTNKTTYDEVYNNPYTNIIEENVNVSGGVTGYTDVALRVAQTVTNENDEFYEWSLLCVSNQYQTTQAQNCAAYFQTNRYSDGQAWGIAIETVDKTTEGINDTNGAVRGMEIALNGAGGAPSDIRRLGLHIVVGKTESATGYSINAGILLSSQLINADNGYDSAILMQDCFCNYGIRLKNSVSYGIDFSECTVVNAAIRLGDATSHARKLQFNHHVLYENSGALVFDFDTSQIATITSNQININTPVDMIGYKLLNTRGTTNLGDIATTIICSIDGNEYLIPVYSKG